MTMPREPEHRLSHLPRLNPNTYRGRAIVHWILGIRDRQGGWLDDCFLATWREVMLHTCARFRLAAPVWCLMPDHIHVLLMGLSDASDQRLAMAFLRKHLRPALGARDWQRQAFDHVLSDHEREKNAFQAIAHYIGQNPVRKSLVAQASEWPYRGCTAVGYPALAIDDNDFWPVFWRIYNRSVDCEFGG